MGKSEGCIVPQKPEDQSGGTKPGNAGEGKAAERLSQVGQGIARTQRRIRDDNRTSCRTQRLALRECSRGEPDALTAHVRFWEGPVVNWTWIDLVTPPEETGGQQGTQTVS